MTTEEIIKEKDQYIAILKEENTRMVIERQHMNREIETLRRELAEIRELHRAKQRYPELENLDSSEVQ